MQLIAGFLLFCPLVLMAFIRLVRHFSLLSLAIFLATLIIEALIDAAIKIRHDWRINQELYSFLSKYCNYRFKLIDMKELVNRYSSYDAIRGILYQNDLKEIGELYVAALEDRSIKKRISNYKSFPRIYSSNVVVLPNDPGDDVLRQFFFFHELGHLTTVHTKLSLLAPRSLIGAILTVMICLMSFPWYMILIALFLVRAWHGSCIGISLIMGVDGGEIERLADGFSIKVLRSSPYYQELEDKLKSLNEKRFLMIRESMAFYKKWFDSPLDIREILDFVKNRENTVKNTHISFIYKHGLSSDATTYNSMVEKSCFPSNYWPAYVLCVILSTGLLLHEPTDFKCIIIILISLIVAVAMFVKYTSRLAYSEIMVDAVIKGEALSIKSMKQQKRLEKSVKKTDGLFSSIIKKECKELSEGFGSRFVVNEEKQK